MMRWTLVLLFPLATMACDNSTGGAGDGDGDGAGAVFGANPARRACENAADCAESAGNGELDVDQCVEDAETGAEDAAELGCEAEYTAYQRCAAETSCDDSSGFLTGCDAELMDLFGCAAGG